MLNPKAPRHATDLGIWLHNHKSEERLVSSPHYMATERLHCPGNAARPQDEAHCKSSNDL